MLETQVPCKELIKALQSLALTKPQQRVLVWLNRTKDSSAKDFGEENQQSRTRWYAECLASRRVLINHKESLIFIQTGPQRDWKWPSQAFQCI